jgi:hypothetical protein
LRKWLSFRTLSFSQKKVFWGLIGVSICILIYALGILPLVEAKKRTEEEILLKKRALWKYEEFLSNRKAVEEELERSLKQHEEAQKRLLPGETPQLGGANLQEIVKRLSEKNGIAIRSFRNLEPKEVNSYRKISIQIEFNPTNSMLSLGQFIDDIEHYEKELMISEMDLLVMNIRMPNQIRGSLVISGLMKGIKTIEKGL